MFYKVRSLIQGFVLRLIFLKFVPRWIYIFVVNCLFRLRSFGHRFIDAEVNGTELFKVVDYSSGFVKFFGFRHQGFMAFERGVPARGLKICDDYLLHAIDFNSQDVVIDIGANIGDLWTYFELKKFDVRYLGVEPGRVEFLCLEKNVSGQVLYNGALGSSNGQSTFFYKPEFGDSSLVNMGDYTQSYEVEVITYSNFISRMGLENLTIKLVKLEAEGFEPEIVSGMGENLHRIEYLAADLGFERGINQDTTAPEVLNFLLMNGFYIVGMHRSRVTFLLRNSRFD